MADRRPDGVLGFAVGKHSRFPLTGDDAVWAARMCWGEEGENAPVAAYAEVLSTMIRRLVIVGERSAGDPVWRSFTDLIRKYSQPINPAWASRGTALAVQRRARITGAAWHECPENARIAVVEVLSGRRGLSAGDAVHFAAEYVTAPKLAANPSWRVVSTVADNMFVSTSQSRGYFPKVYVEPASGLNPVCKLLRKAGLR